MARGKDSIALFEVIHKDKRFARSGIGNASGPKSFWSWLTRRRSVTTTTLTPLGPASASSAPGALLAPSAQNAPTAMSAPSTSSADAAPSVESSVAIASDSQTDSMSAMSPSDIAADSGADAASTGVQVVIDPNRRQIALRMSYSSALIAAACVLVLVGIAYIIGQMMHRGPAPAIGGVSTEELLAGPAQPSVLDVQQSSVSSTPVATAPPSSINPGQAPQRIINEPRPPATHAVVDAKRLIGLNYVIIQSYPEEAMAKEAKELLNRHDILCTVEKDLPGWGKGWYSVVGVVGFERIRNVPECEAYIAQIMAVNNKYAGTPRFKKFNPQWYKWR